MIPTKNSEVILDKCKTIKQFQPLPKSILGYYNYDGDYYIILINDSIRHNERLYRAVLAEEIGHYKTTIGYITPRRYLCNKDRIVVDKKELLALKWATDFLIPNDKLIEVIKNKTANTFDELANYFYVPGDFLARKFKLWLKISLYGKLMIRGIYVYIVYLLLVYFRICKKSRKSALFTYPEFNFIFPTSQKL